MIDKRAIFFRKLIKYLIATVLLCIIAILTMGKYNRKTMATSELTEFNFTGREESWIVPYSGYYRIYCYGAGGFIGANENLTATNPNKKIQYINAKAGSLRASIAYLKKDTQLTIHVGGQSTNGTTSGWDDGGSGRTYSDSNWTLNGFAGGGSSYIKIGNNKIISASGGQGSGNEGCDKDTGNKEILVEGGLGGGENLLNSCDECQWNTDKLNISLINQRAGSGYISIELNEFHPDVQIVPSNTEFTNQNIVLTANVYDRNELPKNAYAWNNENERVESNTFVAQQNGTYKVNVLNSYGYTTEESIEIRNIDKINPIVSNIEQTMIENYGKSIVKIIGNDIENEVFAASGIYGYAITESEDVPTEFITTGSNGREANEFEISKNGTYYAWVIDKAGNISESNKFKVKDVNISFSGKIIWNDNYNKYSTRNAVNVILYKNNNDGTKEEITRTTVETDEDTYMMVARPTENNGDFINYEIVQSEASSYRTIINYISSDENSVVNNIENTLYTLDYSSNITYEAVENNYAQGEIRVKISGEINASNVQQFDEAIYYAETTISIDSKINLNLDTIKFIYEDGNNNSDRLYDYSVTNNTILFGDHSPNRIYGKNSKLTFEAYGIITEQGECNNSIQLRGKLVNYKNEKTDIDLGIITEKQDSIPVKLISNEYYLQNEELTDYELDTIDYYIAVNGEHITALEKQYDGYIENTEHQNRIIEMNVSEESNLVFKRYYDIDKYYFNSNIYEVNLEGTKGTIIKISPNTTFATFKTLIETNGKNLILKDLNESILDDTNLIGTGNKLYVEYANKSYEYEIAVIGDLNGDGVSTITDLAILKQYIVQKINFTEIKEKAADLNYDYSVTLTDFSMLKQYIVKKIEL